MRISTSSGGSMQLLFREKRPDEVEQDIAEAEKAYKDRKAS